MSTLTKNKPLIFDPAKLAEASCSGVSKVDSQRPSLKGLGSALAIFRARSSQRRELRFLSPRQLKDMGITAEEAAKESSKWFWQQ